MSSMASWLLCGPAMSRSLHRTAKALRAGTGVHQTVTMPMDITVPVSRIQAVGNRALTSRCMLSEKSPSEDDLADLS